MSASSTDGPPPLSVRSALSRPATLTGLWNGVVVAALSSTAVTGFTFALAWVVLNVATSKATAGNSYYGAAIGGTIMVGAFAVGGVSGGVFNPAVLVGISRMGVSHWGNFWVLLGGQLAGAAVAAASYKFVNGAD